MLAEKAVLSVAAAAALGTGAWILDASGRVASLEAVAQSNKESIEEVKEDVSWIQRYLIEKLGHPNEPPPDRTR